MSSYCIPLQPENEVDLGRGWKATKLWVTDDGPIVLVQATSISGEVKSRLDTHKSMFIDPLPISANAAGIQNLVNVVNDTAKEIKEITKEIK